MSVLPTAPVREFRRDRLAVLPDGRAVTRWTFGWPGLVTAQVLDLGARLYALQVPDRSGRLDEVVLSPADPADFLGPARYVGATIGRYANRIADGDLPLGTRRHALATQEDGICLHGGPDGFDTRLWDGRPLEEGGQLGLRFRLHSPDGDQGFPGALTATVDYLLDPTGALTLRYHAVADAPTVVNLTNHAYFDLSGGRDGDVLDHELQVEADQYLPIGADLLPLGPDAPVAGTPFDLLRSRRLGAAIDDTHAQLDRAGDGFDHNWVLRDAVGLRRVATLAHPASGRRVECWTTEPGLQVYTGNHFGLDSAGFVTAAGGRCATYAGVALETQRFPDSPHHPTYPSAALVPGEEYRSTTVYRFGVDH
ncbi:aldose epimerase family protein [Streptacidiphilus jiangxiensis]|uniref:Aldose 1-epimerase n=1 Tax=Streptacidiphilus jiangxiensis TaxID=235985 RepID=A0A1H7N1P8_STRJI|nr:aldose epimerase family protein [Streptacidiphilus jiangxiensis]SEL16865.1 aldose 1-epimerase [Streptacidiphilus jiangxiensis]